MVAAAATGSLAAVYLLYRWRMSQNTTVVVHTSMQDKPETERLKDLGNQFFRMKDYKKAMQYYLDALDKAKPEDTALQSVLNANLAAAYTGLNDYDRTIDYANKAIALNPGYPKAYIRRAVAYEKRDMQFEFVTDIATSSVLIGCNDSTRQQIDTCISKLAVKRAEQCYASRPVPKVCLYSIKRFMLDLFPDDIFTDSDLENMRNEFAGSEQLSQYEHAMRAFKTGDLPLCIDICRDLLTDGGNSLNDLVQRAIVLRSTCHFAYMDVERTIEDTNRLLEIKDLSLKMKIATRLRICALYLHVMDMENCMPALGELRQLEPNRSHTSYFLGQVYMLMMNFAMAKHCTKRAISLDSTNPQYEAQMLVIRANEAKAAGKADSLADIIDEMRELGDKHPENIELHVEYAQLLHDVDRVDEAERIMDRCIEQADDSYIPHLLTQKAVQYVSRQMFDQAASLLEQVTSLDPFNETAYQILAMIAYKRDDLDKAIEAFQKSADVSRGQQSLLMSVGIMITLEIQKIIMKRLALPAKAVCTFTSYLSSFETA